jgi:hypothetical protein
MQGNHEIHEATRKGTQLEAVKKRSRKHFSGRLTLMAWAQASYPLFFVVCFVRFVVNNPG